ncbi:MAG: histidinol-phosphatase [Lewinellaceae bacterium]|nr:histidinol-phosphatase [Lewinellaceae bacterium]
MQPANYHTHTTFSDGLEVPEAYVLEAMNQKLAACGFSDHAPILFDPSRPHVFMSPLQLSDYLAEIERLKKVYSGRVQVYKSLEVDYVPGVVSVDSEHIRNAGLDYTIGAVHFVDYYPKGRPWYFAGSERGFARGLEEIFRNDIRACIQRYYNLVREMVQLHPPDIVAHLDLVKKINPGGRYFSEQAPWYREEVGKTLEGIANAGLIMEVNTQGYYKHGAEEPYPSRWVISLAKELGIPMHLASDAHRPQDVAAGFPPVMEMLYDIGLSTLRIFEHGRWIDRPIAPLSRFNAPLAKKEMGK